MLRVLVAWVGQAMLVQDEVAGNPRKWHEEVAWPLHENQESLHLACSACSLGTTRSARFQINGFCFDFGAAGFSCVVCCCSDEVNGAMVAVLHQNTTTFSGWVGRRDALPAL